MKHLAEITTRKILFERGHKNIVTVTLPEGHVNDLHDHLFDADEIEPMVTWGIHPGQAIPVTHNTPELKNLDNALNNEISQMFKSKEFKASFKELKLLNTYKKLPARKVLLIGLGKKGKFKTDCLRKAAAVSAKTLRDAGIKNFATTLQLRPKTTIPVYHLCSV